MGRFRVVGYRLHFGLAELLLGCGAFIITGIFHLLATFVDARQRVPTNPGALRW
ncbi:MAG: hypothetical protein ACFHW5_23230 [Verrucomicrobiota bacterium]